MEVGNKIHVQALQDVQEGEVPYVPLCLLKYDR